MNELNFVQGAMRRALRFCYLSISEMKSIYFDETLFNNCFCKFYYARLSA